MSCCKLKLLPGPSVMQFLQGFLMLEINLEKETFSDKAEEQVLMPLLRTDSFTTYYQGLFQALLAAAVFAVKIEFLIYLSLRKATF